VTQVRERFAVWHLDLPVVSHPELGTL